MKKYNVINYVRYKEDLKRSINGLGELNYNEYTRNELIIKFLPLVENIARKFATSQQASGVLTINDLIQEGSLGLTAAVDKIDWDMLHASEDIEKTLKSFLSKRIKGSIRRAIDRCRGDIRIPEYKLNEIRKDNGKDKEMVAMFFNSIFLSIDAPTRNEEEEMIMQIADPSEPYNIALLNVYLMGLLKSHLNEREYEVLRLSYGLDCEKHSSKQIAEKLNITVDTANIRVSQIKKDAIDKLIESVDASQVLDYL
jgi:RNA polymerase sigma factor (sigma-70 family)